MTMSGDLFKRSLQVAPGGVHSPVRAFKSVQGEPIFFKSASGAHLTSVDGDDYIDFCQSFGPLILGHRDPDVTKAVMKAVETAWSFGACEPYSLELAEFIIKRVPWVEKIRFVSSGTEAVMSALRVARAATRRDKILKFEGCYHGHFDALLVKAGSGLAGESVTDSAGVSKAQAGDTLTAPLDDEKYLEEVFVKNGKDIAAVIIEPLPANYGLLIQRREFIEKIFAVAKKYGALVIFDEVISGFRVAMGGMAELWKFKPDLVTYGKIIGGGFPVGAYGGRSDLMSLVAPEGPVYQAGTLSANPVGMIAGLETLKKIERENVYKVLDERTEKFCLDFNTSADRAKAPLMAIHFGSIWWCHEKTLKPIRTIASIPQHHKGQFAILFHELLKEKIYLAPSGFEVGFVSFAHTDALLKTAQDKFLAALQRSYEG